MKNKLLNKNLRKCKNNEYTLLFAFSLVLSIILFLSVYHGDLEVISIHGKNFWHILLGGNIKHYYVHELNNPPATSVGMLYPFPLYAVFALWDFPLFLLENFMDINFLEIPILCAYSKTRSVQKANKMI